MSEFYKIYDNLKLVKKCATKEKAESYTTEGSKIIIKHNIELDEDIPIQVGFGVIENGEIHNLRKIDFEKDEYIRIPLESKKNKEDIER